MTPECSPPAPGTFPFSRLNVGRATPQKRAGPSPVSTRLAPSCDFQDPVTQSRASLAFSYPCLKRKVSVRSSPSMPSCCPRTPPGLSHVLAGWRGTCFSFPPASVPQPWKCYTPLTQEKQAQGPCERWGASIPQSSFPGWSRRVLLLLG